MSDKNMLEEHNNIMKEVGETYILGLQSHRLVSRRILDIAAQDLDNVIKGTEDDSLKDGFKLGKKFIEHLSKVSIQKPEHGSIEDESLRYLRSLNISCGVFGMSIAAGDYKGVNPCRGSQYEAIQASDALVGMLSTGDVGENHQHLKDALDSYLEQCKKCPYRAFKRKGKA